MVNVNWEEMGKLPKVMAAFGKRAMKMKEDMSVFKKREDFASDQLYGEYIMQNVHKGSVVRMRVNYPQGGLEVGDLVTVDSVPDSYDRLTVILAESERQVTFFSHRVEILTLSEILASKK